MKIAIHLSPTGFSHDWIEYCKTNEIPYKIIDCYSTHIISDLADCNVLLFHHHHTSAKDFLFAKGLLYAVEQSGKMVFPEFNAGWHFDDKVGQKYLLEAIQAPLVKTYVFYSKHEALEWIGTTSFPKVFKLRGGAGSNNVKLIRTASDAREIIRKAFGSGFPSYDGWQDLKENFRKFRIGKSNLTKVLKSLRRFFVSTEFGRVSGAQKGYVYFQEFIPDNTFDIRVVTIGDRAFAIKRLTRDGDFRASGSGFILYNKSEIPLECVNIAFETSDKMKASVVAYDFVFDKEKNPLIVEINFGYAHKAYFNCPGYWDTNLVWHEQKFNSAHWIIENLIHNNNNNNRV